MSKRVAVVTGGIGGLGTEICKALARAGRTVVAADLGTREDRIADFRRDTEGLDIHFEAGNVGDFDACADLVRKVEQTLGPIDILVNAAGITRDKTLRKMDRTDWDAVMNINLDGVFNMCEALAPLLSDRNVLKVMHSASEDIVALKRACGVSPTPLFDTQIAAGIAGIGAGMPRRVALEFAELVGRGRELRFQREHAIDVDYRHCASPVRVTVRTINEIVTRKASEEFADAGRQ